MMKQFINKQRALTTFMEMVQIDSVSYHEKEMAQYLIRLFQDMGYEAFEDVKCKEAVKGASVGNVIVKIPGDESLDPIILCAHMDTVEPGNGIKPKMTEDGTRIVSSGDTILGADDKGGIAQIIEAVRVLKEQNLKHPPLELLFPICEEVGLLGAKYVDATKISGKIAYVIDGGKAAGDAIIGGPSYIRIWGKIYGQAAHAGGEPEKGISSIQVMAEAIHNMQLLRIDHNTTTNIGRVICDYPINVVPEVTSFDLEVRSLEDEKAKAQAQKVIAALQNACEKYGARLEYELDQDMVAYETAKDNPVLKHFEKVCQKRGVPMNAYAIGGGTDLSALTGSLGVQGMVISVGSDYAHQLQETLYVDKFLDCTEQLLYIVTSYAE